MRLETTHISKILSGVSYQLVEFDIGIQKAISVVFNQIYLLHFKISTLKKLYIYFDL